MGLNVPAIIHEFKQYRDHWHLLVKKDKDGGDTAHTTGVYYSILLYLASKESNQWGGQALLDLGRDLAMLRHSSGRYIRHPDPKKWYSNVNNFTRDQNNPLFSALVCANTYLPQFYGIKMQEILDARAQRLYFHFNSQSGDDKTGPKRNFIPDPPAPVEFGLYSSVGRFTRLWVYVGDLQLVFDVTVGLRLNTWDSAAGTAPILLARNLHKPTFLSKFALFLYKKQKDFVLAQIDKYYGEEGGNNGLAPMQKLFRALFERI